MKERESAESFSQSSFVAGYHRARRDGSGEARAVSDPAMDRSFFHPIISKSTRLSHHTGIPPGLAAGSEGDARLGWAMLQRHGPGVLNAFRSRPDETMHNKSY